MHRNCAIAIVAAFGMWSACSPAKHEMPADLSKAAEDPGFKAAIGRLDSEDRALLEGYVVRSLMVDAFRGLAGGESLPKAATIGDAIAAQRSFLIAKKSEEEQQKILADKIESERREALANMEGVLKFTLISKEFHKSDYRKGEYGNKVLTSFSIQNTSLKAVKGFKGAVAFTDMFGDQVMKVRLSVDDPLAAGDVMTWNGKIDINQFENADVKFAQYPPEKLMVSWIPDMFLFADGSSSRMPTDSDQSSVHRSNSKNNIQVIRGKTMVTQITNAALQYMLDNTNNCPNGVNELVAKKYLKEAASTDPWGQTFSFLCPGAHDKEAVDVTSSGPDKVAGTGDDIKSWE